MESVDVKKIFSGCIPETAKIAMQIPAYIIPELISYNTSNSSRDATSTPEIKFNAMPR